MFDGATGGLLTESYGPSMASILAAEAAQRAVEAEERAERERDRQPPP